MMHQMVDDKTNTTVTAKEFETLIRERLKHMGATAIGCARRNNLPRDAIRSVLRGHEPKISRAAEICDALGLELDIRAPHRERLVTDPSVGLGHWFPGQVDEEAPSWLTDRRLRTLVRALVEEWDASDERGKASLEASFKAYFPKMA